MRIQTWCVAMLGSLGAARLAAQGTIPVRTIGPILAASTENVGTGITVRSTSDGHVFVAAGARQRVYLFDSTLGTITVIRDSATGTSSMMAGGSGLIPYAGDSTLLPDVGSGALEVLDPTGKRVRSMAPPRGADLFLLDMASTLGHPAFDEKGRLIYRGVVRWRRPPAGVATPRGLSTQDTSPLVRGDFDARRADTLAWFTQVTPMRADLTMREDVAGGPPVRTFWMLLNPFPTSDEWAMLSDGTIAIVRVQDYHIDWIDPDGRRRSTAKMPIDWRRYTSEEKRQRADSARAMAAERLKSYAPVPGGPPPSMKAEISVVPDSEFPTYWPSISPGSVMADLHNHLWILPTTSTHAGNGFTYDVVDREGRVIERVQLPKGRVLVGFGQGDALYLSRSDGTQSFLERGLIHSPK